MKSYKSYGRASFSVNTVELPTLEEHPSTEVSEGDSSVSLDNSQDLFDYPADLLGVSWGSYLSTPPTRQEEQRGSPQMTEKEGNLRSSEREQNTAPELEPHPLLQQIDGLMSALVKSKEELIKFGMDSTALSSLSDATLSSHRNLKQLVSALSGEGANQILPVINTADLLQTLVEYLREVLTGLVSQGNKLNIQAGLLQRTAKQFSKHEQKSLKDQKDIQDAISNTAAQLDIERQELEFERRCIEDERDKLKKMMHKAEESHLAYERKRGQMDPPHIIAQGRNQLTALLTTQKQQSRLEKAVTQQQREIRHLQQAHDMAKNELLAVQDRATMLQRKLAKQIEEVKKSEASLAAQVYVKQESVIQPSMEIDRGERKSYHNISKAHIRTTLKGITTAHKSLCTEIERMQRQLVEQQKTERKISRQLEDNCLRLQHSNYRTKQHATAIKSWRGNNIPIPPSQLSRNVVLPKINQEYPKKATRKRKPTQEISILPALYQDGRAAGYFMGTNVPQKDLPSYHFSKTELVTLAKFDDRETAEQVMKWLAAQGKLDE